MPKHNDSLFSSRSWHVGLWAGFFALSSGLLSVEARQEIRASPTAMNVVQRGLTAGASVAYVGELETIRFDNHQAEVTIVRIEHRPPSTTRRWYEAPASLSGDSVVNNGRETYEFDEHHHEFIEDAREFDASHLDRFELIKKNYRAVFGPKMLVAGRHARKIHLLQRATGRHIADIALDDEKQLPLEREMYRSDGSLSYRMHFNSIRFLASDTFPRGLFSVDPPRGFRIIHKEIIDNRPVPLRMVNVSNPTRTHQSDQLDDAPRNLLYGFTLLAGHKITINGVETQQSVYSDGVRKLSLFESPIQSHPTIIGLKSRAIKVDSVEGTFIEGISESLFSWPTSRSYMTLVGDLDSEELSAIAASIKPD